ncbi:MarR family transcriptional regulator [Streptomyces abikoensis]|uniref:MarR family transcriptional regulator n=1 Tax=Streptomyces abikoensis TaxID=97398 RepID=UPI003570BFBD
MLHRYDFSCSDAAVLNVLRRGKPPYAMAPKQIAERLALTSGALTPRIDRLEEAGLIRRLPVLTDRRRTRGPAHRRRTITNG